MTAEREIELKLEISPADLRRLATHPLITAHAVGGASVRQVDSRYFDSVDGRLARAGFALRLRRDGDDRVQTLKGGGGTTGGLFERLEYEVPYAGDVPDLSRIDDRSVVRAVEEALDGAALEERFRTEFQRSRRTLRSGAAEFRLDLDQGRIVAGDHAVPISEAELELTSGSPAALFEFALLLQEHVDLWPEPRSKAARGHALARRAAPPAAKGRRIGIDPEDNLDTVLRAVLSHCLHQWTSNADLAADGSDPEGVHQMRIGVRRMRAALRGFRALLPGERIAVFRSELRWLGQALGPVRDLDVFLAEVIRPLESERGDDEAFKTLREETLALREACQHVATTALRSQRYTRLALELGGWIAASGWRDQPVNETSARLFQPARDYASVVLGKGRRALKRRGAALPSTDIGRHAVRLRMKRLRYSAEFFRDLYPAAETKRFLKRAKQVQRALGRANDCASAERILRVVLERLGEERMPAHDQAAGFVNGWMVQHTRDAHREAEEAWRAFRATRPFWKD